MTTSTLPTAGFFRRLGALTYDVLIVLAIEMIAAGVVVAVLHALLAMDLFNFAPYLDVSDFLSNHVVWSWVYKIYLVFVGAYFFFFFWTRAGQTLGMRAWKMQLQTEQGDRISSKQAIVRLLTSGLGVANIWAIIDRQNRGLHDVLAKTKVVVLPKAN